MNMIEWGKREHERRGSYLYHMEIFFEFSGDNSMTKQASRKSGKWLAESERKIARIN